MDFAWALHGFENNVAVCNGLAKGLTGLCNGPASAVAVLSACMKTLGICCRILQEFYFGYGYG